MPILAGLLSLGLIWLGLPLRATASGQAPVLTASQSSTSGTAPTVVVLDVSGSMNDDDGSGTVKLAGAKRSIAEMFDGAAPSSVVGLWSFPTPGDDCGEGGFALSPRPLGNGSALTAAANALPAAGGTPTGKALGGAADGMIAASYDKATIVLVSDGESNCSSPPCPVARNLVQRGFDLTVDTVGFRQSDAGRAELQCVASATGGSYYDTQSSQQLGSALQQISNLGVSLSLAFDPHPLAGGHTTITATLHNASGVAARGVHHGLTFVQAQGLTAPAALPPVIDVGNVPGGTTPVVRSWTVETGQETTITSSRFTVSAWGGGIDLLQQQGRWTTIRPGLTSQQLGGFATALTDPNYPVVIMGDSYSSGQGTFDYLPGDRDHHPSCRRSEKTYLAPMLVAIGHPPVILACGGAQTKDFTGSQTDNGNELASPQLAQLQRLDRAPGAVLLTIGGNDIGFAAFVKNCLLGTCDGGSSTFIPNTLATAKALEHTLPTVYEQVWTLANTPQRVAARGGRSAPVIVLPYPSVVRTDRAGGCYQFSGKDGRAAAQLTSTLDATIARSVQDARGAGYEVYFEADSEQAVQPDHTVCESGDQAWINGQTRLVAPETLHPKVSGYEAITTSFLNWAGGAQRNRPTVAWQDAAKGLPSQNVLDTVTDLSDTVLDPPPVLDLSGSGSNGVTTPGGSVAVRGSGYQPGTPVTLTLHSTALVLGTVIADAHGRIDGEVRVPASAALGAHTLTSSGIDAGGRAVLRSMRLSVIARTPLWVTSAALLAAVLLVAGVTLCLRGVIRRRSRRKPVSPR